MLILVRTLNVMLVINGLMTGQLVVYLFKIFILFFVLQLPLQAQLHTEIMGGYENFNPKQNYSAAAALLVKTDYRLNNRQRISLKYQFSNPVIAFSNPARNQQIGLQSHTIILLYSYTIKTGLLKISLNPFAGAGLKIIRRDAYLVDLGALGKRTIASTNDRFQVFETGLQISRPLFKGTSIAIQSNVSVYHFDPVYSSFTIAGGINVGLF